jgi:putative DNA primase/helicase
MTLAELISRLEGVRSYASYLTARCPAHDDRNASFSIRQGKDGKVLLKCFAGCGYESITAALGGDRPGRASFSQPGSTPQRARDDAERTDFALRIWRQARSASGTIVEAYLRSRAITMSVPPSLRFNARLKHPTGYLPAMVAAVQQADGAIVAIHRTFLKPDGSGKANVERQKMMLGPCVGGAVREPRAQGAHREARKRERLQRRTENLRINCRGDNVRTGCSRNGERRE